MLHECLPQTYTKERLAEWITSNKVDTATHSEDFPLTEDEIKEFEHASSIASRAIDRLKAIEKYFKETLKKGTPFNFDKGDHDPVTVTIPPTKGLDVLNANREFADKSIERGVRTETTIIYLIPHPEESKIVGVDIEGNEWPKFSRYMTNDEINQHKPLLKQPDKKGKSAAKELRDNLAKNGMKIDSVEGNTVHITTGHDKEESEELDL